LGKAPDDIWHEAKLRGSVQDFEYYNLARAGVKSSIPAGMWPQDKIAWTAAWRSSIKSVKVEDMKTWSFFFFMLNAI